MLKILLIIIITLSLQTKRSNELCKTGLALKLQGKYTLAIEKFDHSIKYKENIDSYFLELIVISNYMNLKKQLMISLK